METGIYTIINKLNGKVYVGSSTKSLKWRLWAHINHLRKNTHHNIKLQNSFNKYGEKNFEFEILEECLPEFCISQELYWMNLLNSLDKEKGYNISSVLRSHFDYAFVKEIGKKISLANKNNLVGEKHPMWGKKRIPTMLGKKHTPEAILKMKQFQKNRFRSEEEIAKSKIKKTGKDHPNFGKKVPRLSEWNKLNRVGDKLSERKIILKYDLKNNFIEEYLGLKEAADKNNMKGFSKICEVCNNNRKTAGGFIWKYKEKSKTM